MVNAPDMVCWSVQKCANPRAASGYTGVGAINQESGIGNKVV